ncbi:hypothetical protein K3217_09820 [bacterium BD-1]|nr:hypothetical protein [Ottowia caeni]
MDFIDLILHLAGFLAPALFVALVVALAGGMLFGKRASVREFFRRWCRQGGVNFAVGLAVSLTGLFVTSADGRMLTYAALVVAVGTSQFVLSRKS